MAVEPSRGSRPQYGLLIATVLMCALAGGAIWSVLQLYLRRDMSILALPIAWIIAAVVRNYGLAHRGSGALMGALGTSLACAYALYLLAAAKVASSLGVPMRDTLLSIGLDMAAAVAWAAQTPLQRGILVFAVAWCAWLIWRRPRGQR